MIFFSKKPKQEEEIKKIKKAVEGGDISEKEPEMPKQIPEVSEKIEPEEPERIPHQEPTVSAPLFVKIEKYRNILNNLNDLKATVLMLKNALIVQKEIERTRDENINLIQSGINKIDKKLLSQSGHTVSSPRLNEFSIAKFVQTLRGACAFQTEENKTRRFFVEIRNSRNLLETAASSKALNICFSGVLTPDHVIRTKNKMVHIDSVPENDADLKDYLNKKIYI